VVPAWVSSYFQAKDAETPLQIAGPTVDGGRFDLADHRGKVVLVDFWATWCGPCLAELPNVRAVYDEFHDQGLDAVSISLDVDRAALTHFLQSHPEPWPQVFFDPEDRAAQENHPARRYDVNAIPCLMVVDREGKLIVRDVRGAELRRAVAGALGHPVSGSLRLSSAVDWLLRAALYGTLFAPWWLLLACGTVATALVAGADRLVRLVRRPRAPVPV
jgi:thiol-disulfide isomerase/thioredoxin